jgi:hypothetical protein
MQSTQTFTDTDPHDIFLIEPEIVRELRANKASSSPAHDATSPPSPPEAHTAPNVSAGAPVAPVDTTFRATAVDNIQVPSDRIQVPGDRPVARWATRAFMGLFALCSAVAAAAWQHYGDTAKQMIAQWTPPFVLAASPPAEKPAVAEQPASPAVQAAAADQGAAAEVAAQPAPAAQPAEPAAPAGAAPAPESTQSLQSMARDVAMMGQQIEELKATIEQLKAGQEQMSRDIAKNAETKNSQVRVSEQNLRPRMPAPPPRSVAAAPARKPRPAFAPAQAAVAPMLPPPQAAASPAPLQPEPQPQAAAAEDGGPVVRPPMPLR